MTSRFRGFLLMTAGAAASAAVFWLLRDHWGHALGLLPFLLFFTCPLMHLFMHHGHGHGHDHHEQLPDPGQPKPRSGA